MAKQNRSWIAKLLEKRNRTSRKSDQAKTRRLLLEALEPRTLLSGTSLSTLLASITPNPHPSGDLPADTSRIIPLANYSPFQLMGPTGIASIDAYMADVGVIYANIASNPAARPAVWCENVTAAANQVSLHFDDNGMLVKYWKIDWGDGNDPQTVVPQPWVVHQYPAAGQYTIAVTAYGPDGSYSATSMSWFADAASIGGSGGGGVQVSLADAPPTLHVGGAQNVAQGQTFALDNLASFSYVNASNATGFTYSIDWGDGSQAFNGSNVDVIAAGGTGSPFLGALTSDAGDGPLTHVYSNTGTYYLAVTVTADDSGLSDTQTIPINVVALTPAITGLPSNNTCDEGTTVTLSASAAVDSSLTDPVAYNWQILDSSGNALLQSTDPTISYTFTGPDTYTVSLVASVDSVTSAPVNAIVTVNDPGPAFVNPWIPDIHASIGQTLTLPPVSFNDPGLSQTHTATISWGDGTRDDATVTEEESSDGTMPGTITDSHAYTSVPTGSDYYTATLTLTDDNGVSVSENFNVYVVSAVVSLSSFAPSSDGSQLQVTYSIANANAAPFNIDIYSSPDGTTPDQLLMSYPVTASGDLAETSGTPHTVSFTPAFDDIASNYHLVAVSDSNSDPTENTVEFTGGVFVAASVTQSPPQNVLYVFGTVSGGSDTVYIHGNLDSPNPNTVVFDGGTPFSIGSTITDIHVRGEDGNDTFKADPDVTLPLWLYGGPRTNTLTGGAGNNVLVGGIGQNIIHSSNGLNTPQTVDDSDATSPGLVNYFHVGDPANWATQSVVGAFNGEEQSHGSSSGGDLAVWTFDDLDPTAYYDVYVTWRPLAGASTAAQYTVIDDGVTTSSGLPTVNQQQPPADIQDAGVFWHDLGVFQATSGTLILHLGTDTTGEVLADAAMIVPLEIAPVTNLTIGSFSVDSSGNLSVSYTINGENSPPFSIGIYGSPDGQQAATLLQTYPISDPKLLGGGGQSYTASFPADLGSLDSSQYVVADLDCDNQVAETSKADNISAPLSGVFEQDDGTLLVLGSLPSINSYNFTVTQDIATGNVTVNTTDSAGDPISSESLSGVSALIVSTPGGNNSIDIDPSVTVPVSVFAGPSSNVNGTPATTSVAVNAALPQVMIGAENPVVSESGGSAGEFLISRTNTSGGDLTVYYQISGTAENGTDYATIGSSVTLSGGATSATVDVTPYDLSIMGGSQTVILTLVSNPIYNVSAFSSATVTIADDDGTFGPGTGPVSAGLTLYDPDGSTQGSPAQAVLGDFIPMAVNVSGDTTGMTFSFEYDPSLVTITTNENGGGVVQPDTPIALTGSVTIFYVWGANPNGGTDEDGDVTLVGYGGNYTAPSSFSIAPEDFGALHMNMTGVTVESNIDLSPATVEVGQTIDLAIVRGLGPTQIPVTSGITWSLPGSTPVVEGAAGATHSSGGNYVKSFDGSKNNDDQVSDFNMTGYHVLPPPPTFSFYWVDAGGSRVTAVVVSSPLFPQGSSVTGTFIVKRPNVAAAVTAYTGGTGGFNVGDETTLEKKVGTSILKTTGPKVIFADPGIQNGATFEADAIPGWTYVFCQVVSVGANSILTPQLGKGVVYHKSKPTSGLDSHFSLLDQKPYVGAPNEYVQNVDSPTWPVFPQGFSSFVATFTTYVMCKPDDCAAGIYVPLAELNWDINLSLNYLEPKPVIASSSYVKIAGSKWPFASGKVIKFSDTTEFPEWAGIVTDTIEG